MIDDFLATIRSLKPGNKQRKEEIKAEEANLDVRIKMRLAVFRQTFVFSLFWIPLIFYFIFYIFYPSQRIWWDWRYWLLFMGFSILVYGGALYVAPRIQRAKQLYLWQAIFLSQPWLFLILFGQFLAFQILPSDYWKYYFPCYIPVIIYSPILFRKQLKDLQGKMATMSVVGNLDFKPIWDDQKYLADRYNPRHNQWISQTFAVIILAIPFFIVLKAAVAMDYFHRSAIILGSLNALTLLAVVEATYRSFIIHYYLTSLEKMLEKPIMLGTY